ncbi:MAG: response regulator [Flavobacteriales bacterium]|nr:response regulator [Flavobacteriales bacterium]
MLLLRSSGSAQYDTIALPFRSLTIEDGLSQGMIHYILQDRHGFMWFSTKDGLNRYDGYHFKVYRNDATDTTTVADSYITTLYEDRRGRLWVGTNAGLDHFDRTTETFVHIRCGKGSEGSGPSDPHHLLGCYIASIDEDEAGNLWVSTEKGLNRLELDAGGGVIGIEPILHAKNMVRGDINREGRLYGFVESQFAFTIDTRTEPFRIDTLVIDGHRHSARSVSHWYAPLKGDPSSTAHPWFDPLMIEDTVRSRSYGVHGHGVVEYEPATRSAHSLFSDPGLVVAMATPEPAIDGIGRIWMPGLVGCWRFDPQAGRLSRVTARDPNLVEVVENAKVGYRDRSGLIWIGTSGYGILIYDPRVERFHTHPETSLGWMAPVNDGQLILHSRGRLMVLDPKSDTYTMDMELNDLRERTGFKDEVAEHSSTVQDRDGIYWMSIGQLERYDHEARTLQRFTELTAQGSRNFSTYCFPLHLDTGSGLWFGAGEAFHRFDRYIHEQRSFPYPIPAEHRPYLFLQCIHQDASGIFWLGTMKGLLRFDPASSTWDHHASSAADSTTLSHDMIFSIAPDPAAPDRYLWIGTNGGGLNRFDKKTGCVRRFTTHHGLPNNVVYGVLADDQGHLWMSTNKGLSRFDPASATFRNFTAADGLQGDEFNRYAYCRLDDGTLYFGGIQGFNHFDPQALIEDTVPVAVRLIDVKLMNRSVAFRKPGSPLSVPPYLSKGMEIQHGANMVTFEFAAMEFSSPGAHAYQYKLEGFDRDWVHATNGNSAIYTNLDPGEYTFRVRAANRDGIWGGDGASFRLKVLPPWWRTWWFYTLCVIATAGGAFAYVGGVRRQRRNLERTVVARTKELTAAKERAEHSEKIKQQFLANMSHEIRTPMNAIMGMTGTLRRRTHPPEQDKYLDAIAQSSENLLVIINDILDLSKIEAGKITLENAAFDPRAVITHVRDMLQVKADEKGLRCEVEFEPDIPATLVGDPTRLQQVLLNLLGNAIKFTERGSVSIHARPGPHGPEGSGAFRLAVDVIDTGIGIAKEKQKAIFKEFDQAYSDTTRKYGGTGLGLTISKHLVEMQGGSIALTSEPGQGSTFTVEIPYAIGEGTVGPERVVNDAPLMEGLRILLAEDNAFNAMVAMDELADAIRGVHVDHAMNGKVALAMATKGTYDLILMDVQMPEMNGYDATRAIRRLNGARAHVPIIAMTANVMEGEVKLGQQAGMDGFVPKPFKREELIQAIRSVIGK